MALPPFEATSSQEAECCHLGRPIFESLDHPAIFRFRKDYQQHRLGHAKGAKGEVGEALREVQEQQQQHGGAGQQHHAAPRLPEGISEEDAESLLSPFGAYEADSPFHRDEQLLLQIARWRMAYQRFRTGGARGAAGDLEEIARGLSLKALKLLPVVQLAEVLKRDKQPKAPELQLPSPHLHFGGGKLGFGLVLQAMLRAQMKDLILLQRPSEDFKPLLEAEKRESVPVFVNGEKVCSLRVPEEERVILYACENDHGAVARLKEDLKNKLLLLPCMVDRICASRHIFSDKIEVVAEPYEGEIVVLDRPETAPPPPFGGSNVHAPQLQKALDAAAAEPLLAALRELSLLKETEMNEKQRNIMWGWLAARCLHLLWEHDKEVIKRTHNLQTDEEVVVMLLDYGVKTLKR
ncbi:hypothetical protein, conserved [Eimeria acervulina]|uniref:Uncharacterized protein n=1 Tax=Eimeria acervulina TaxID=5801 RepID=U6GZ71_EIMAC|nr:hypothetical protein, conserved [Eimeria acervulina]CDI83834.1 hypothetical protein, conserved [Eimeria acervulina]